MKKILFAILIISLSASAQNKMVYASPYVLIWDSTTKNEFNTTIGNNSIGVYQTNKKTLSSKSTSAKLVDIYEDFIFSFTDTLQAADVVADANKFRITLHTSPLTTTKRNVLVKDILLVYDTATQSLIEGEQDSFPLTIKNTSTGVILIKILKNGNLEGNIPSSRTAIGTTGIYKVIIN